MTLDTTKPMMTRDGRKVVEFHVFKDGTIAATVDEPNRKFCLTFAADGRYLGLGQEESQHDLINCPPEPVVLWLMLYYAYDRWNTLGSDSQMDGQTALDWRAADPANRRVVRVEVPE